MNKLNRVVRDHRQLLHIALPEQESEPTRTFSLTAQLDRTIAERVVFAVWLPFISAAGAVMLVRRDKRQTERVRQQGPSGQSFTAGNPNGRGDLRRDRPPAPAGLAVKSEVHRTFP